MSSRRITRDSDDTKRRLFEAATAEFATHGIAGARIDRIAAAAGANKQLIYAYFGNKRQLFEGVVSEQVNRFLAAVPFDAGDLPAYAAAAFDFYLAHPEMVQLGFWHSLEPGEAEHRIPVIEAAIKERTRRIAQAQKDGRVNAGIPASDLLALIGSIAVSWTVATPERKPRRRSDHRLSSARRKAVFEATRRLVAPGS